jgi:mRNA-degrading endonuclease RelE of RelBE toxin-antitoxin system
MSQQVTLFMHDSFMDSFSNLPKKIQKKTREFMKKFKEDPTSSGINYEKIATFTDQSLRTVRIDQKYRAIIQQPQTGTGYHLLWVDNHDEAMAWARNKVFEWNQNTQSFQMYDKPEVSTQHTDKKETSPLAKYSKEDLLAVGTPESMLETVWGLISVDDLNSIKANLPVDTYEYLYYLFEGISLEEILEEIDAGKTADEGEISDNAKKHVYVLTEDEELEEMLSGDFEKWKIYLHPSQKKIAYGSFNGPIKVTGGAGTGKTVCAMHRAGYLSKALELFDKPILFTTYTKSLTSYLQSTIRDFKIPTDKLIIKNFDKLVFELAKNPEYQIISSEAGFLTESQEKEVWKVVLEFIPSAKDENFLSEEYNEVILKNNVKDLDTYHKTSRVGRSTRIGRQDKVEIWKLVEEFRKRKEMNYSKYEVCNLIRDYFETKADRPFSHLICDEVQDFSNVELSAMRVLVKEKENDLFFVGDPYQNIYARKINFSKSGISVRGRRSKKLKLNYRTTEEIKLQALKVVNQEVYDDFDGGIESTKGYISLMHGNEPAYQVFKTPEEEDAFLIKSIKDLLADEKVKAPEICICGRTNHIVDQIKMILNKHDIHYHDLSSSKENFTSIRVSTFHNLKGHEFKYLFLKGVSKDTVPFKHPGFNYYDPKEKEEYLKSERSLYYVVFTRAREGLVISGVGEKSEWF